MQIAVIYDDSEEGIIRVYVVPTPTMEEAEMLEECHSHLINDTMEEDVALWLGKWIEDREPDHVSDHMQAVSLMVPTCIIFTGIVS